MFAIVKAAHKIKETCITYNFFIIIIFTILVMQWLLEMYGQSPNYYKSIKAMILDAQQKQPDDHRRQTTDADPGFKPFVIKQW